MIPCQNLFADLNQGSGETSDTLAESRSVRVERIVSRGAASPDGFWYDQENDEWVLLARGEATLEFENGEMTEMKTGDHL
jgi:cupin 2 domain-containing protein